MMIRKLLLAVALLSLCLFAVPPTASAGLFSRVDCSGDQSQSAICTSRTTNDPLTGTNGSLDNIANIIAIVAGSAAGIVILVSGLRYITSSGDAEKVASAKKTLIYALVGVVIIVLARFIIDFVLGRL